MADEEARARLAQRGVRTLSPADALAGMADVDRGFSVGSTGPHKALWPGSTGPASCRSTSRRGGGHSWRSWSVRCPISRPRPTASGKTQLVERLTHAPVQQRKKLVDGLPARRGGGGDARRCRGDPRGRRILRSRHGFADGRRIAAPHRARQWARSCRRPWRWTTHVCPTWRITCSATCSGSASRPLQVGASAGLGSEPRQWGARMSRSRSSRWHAVFPAHPIPKLSGRCCPAVSMRSGKSRKTDSTSTSFTTRIQRLRARSTAASVDSSTESTDSIRNSSVFPRARLCGSIRSSG